VNRKELIRNPLEQDSLEIRIRKYIDLLDNLRDGENAAKKLVFCGEKAVPYVQKYLMEGKPSHIYQPRQRAVKILAKLGAKNALIEYLIMKKEIVDPIIRFGEEAVENTAARALAKWRSRAVFESLLKVARLRKLPGVIETLGQFRRAEIIPLLIEGLGDDMCSNEAEESLRLLGSRAKPALIEILISDTNDFDESPSGLMRRRTASRLLAELSISPDDWQRLKPLIHDDDLEIVVAISKIALTIADDEDRQTAVDNLIEAICVVDWNVQIEIEYHLLRHKNIARYEIEKKIAELSERVGKNKTIDRGLQELWYCQLSCVNCL